MNAVTEQAPRGVIADMARQYRMDPVAFERTLRATVFPQEASKEQFAAFLLVAREYDLNPLTKQIYAFPDKKRGGVIPIVPVDGWMTIVNREPTFDGMEFEDTWQGDTLVSITCRMYRKDRARPTSVTEYLGECQRETDPWRQWPVRMLRHKAVIQCARYAFALSGIHDPDEADRIIEAEVTPAPVSTEKSGTKRLRAAVVPPADSIVDVRPVPDEIPAGAVYLERINATTDVKALDALADAIAADDTLTAEDRDALAAAIDAQFKAAVPAK